MPARLLLASVASLHVLGGALRASPEPSAGHVAGWQCALNERPHLAGLARAPAGVASFHLLNSSSAAGNVLAVDPSSLGEMTLKGTDFLVTFYAPWCKYSQLFVLNGGVHAPLERLSTALEKRGGPRVFKFNIEEHERPVGFQFEGVPTIILVTEAGKRKVEYMANPLDLDKLVAFVVARASHKPAQHISLAAALNATRSA
uniref:Thioredoxin domain-containing protein n=1 Tax=Pyrodinium bahamense TaxID=73915 RepID=A0A7S0ASU4_9DINO|mmetsp:Transcript_41543/g.115540  ORF Transcript_41543/g.115540 Transcript_41543/m.115540 type:complete len:201 (+) Transcript_41543:76-678(+)